VDHDKEVPFRLLKPVKKLSVGENSQNLIIEGDNLEALKALLTSRRGTGTSSARTSTCKAGSHTSSTQTSS
jgi:hypothetical protein